VKAPTTAPSKPAMPARTTAPKAVSPGLAKAYGSYIRPLR
jgi:hypothetical protein